MINSNQIRDREIVSYIEQINDLTKQLELVKNSFGKTDYEAQMKAAVEECFPVLCQKYPEFFSNTSYTIFGYRTEDNYIRRVIEINHYCETPRSLKYNRNKVDTDSCRITRLDDFRVDVQRLMSNQFTTLSSLEKSLEIVQDVEYLLDIDRKNKFITKLISITNSQIRRRQLYTLSTEPIETKINKIKSKIGAIIRDDFESKLYSTGLIFKGIGYEDEVNTWRREWRRRDTLPTLQLNYHDYVRGLTYVKIVKVSKSGKTCTVQYKSCYYGEEKVLTTYKVRMSRIDDFLNSLTSLGNKKVRQMPTASMLIEEYNRLTGNNVAA